MVTLLTACLGCVVASSISIVIGYITGRHGGDEDNLRRADTAEAAWNSGYQEGFRIGTRDAERRCDEMFCGDWDRGYNVGLEVGRGECPGPAIINPEEMTTTATAVREARLKWIRLQMRDHLDTYRDAFWRVLEVARDVGERYRKVESSGTAGLVPIGDALNVCVYVADIAKRYDEERILTQPHRGVFEGRSS